MAFHGCPDEKKCQIYLVLAPFFAAVFANIEKHELAVTGSAVVLAVTSAGCFISLTRRASDFLEQEMICNDSSVP